MSDRAFQTSRDVVIGLADGAIIVSSVLAGLSGADQPSELLINAGVVTAIAGAVVFAFSRFSSGKEAEKEFVQGKDTAATNNLIKNLGLDEDFKKSADLAIEADQKLWKEQVNALESGPGKTALKNAIAIGLSFLAAGFFALAAYFLHNASDAFFLMTVAVSILLLICGVIKARLSGRNVFAGALIQWFTGAAATGLCYLMGDLLG